MLVIMESRNGKTGAWKNVWWAAAVLRKRGVPLDVTVVSDVQNVDGERLLEIEISLEGWILTDGALCLPQGTVAPSKRDFEIAAEAALVVTLPPLLTPVVHSCNFLRAGRFSTCSRIHGVSFLK
jgi:hypothetical protein